ncbi:hypothetical protein [Ciceribacter sp. T2.26MG-112.2]|uniref:hypothetical protein n=1 Tax=Ciceribacter sp. T2.26MG-112.2 TaxID=3137154 RepID=UPI0012B685C0|nr:hypothetical protein [Ciceribacter naphthalenivorans]
MQRKKRNPAKFDVIELYKAIGRDRDYVISAEADLSDFLKTVSESLKASQTNPTLLHGKRAEALFAHVAGAMGRCQMIKQEDSGDIFVSEGDFEVPDYRVFLKDGRYYLVEVKNFHMKTFKAEFTVPKKTIRGLEAYAQLNNIPLRFAIYFSKPNVWVLLAKEAFRQKKRHYVVNFTEAIARNEMAILGDRMIATLPDLRFVILGRPDECSIPADNGDVYFTTRAIHFYCRDQEVTDNQGKRIIFYLMRYGNWPVSEATPLISDSKVVGLRWVFSPENPVEDQPFQVVGNLSAMISNSYRELTVGDNTVKALDVKQDPKFFALDIPEDYKEPSLPLWQFILQPNYSAM